VPWKRRLSPERLNTLTEEGVAWLNEQAHGDPTAFWHEVLRDTVAELIFHKVFGAERRACYEPLFGHLYSTVGDLKNS
jgi:hypothetical protein